MTLVVPNAAEADALDYILNRVLTLKLYANDIVPGETDTAATYTEVTGGGYVAKTLAGADWTITSGAPSVGLYDTVQDFTFTGVTGGSGDIYGYYVVDADNLLRWAERFEESVVPYSPIAASVIRIQPRFQAS